jgi:phosphoglycolate phosphatase
MTHSRLVLFDVDGTLIDSQRMIVAAMTSAFEAEGLATPPRDAILTIVGLSLVEAMTVLGGGSPGFPAEALADHYRAAFRTLRLAGTHDEPMFPGALAAIDRLSRRGDILLGLATGKSMRGVRAILAMHGLEDRFQTIQTADGNPSKPDPTMVNRAMAELGATPENTVVVGDTAWDVRMARAAGASAIGVAWGYHPSADLREAGATCVLDGFDDLDAALASVFVQ